MMITNTSTEVVDLTRVGRLAYPRDLWVVVLAGGDGVRLSSLTTALHGHPLPKQFAWLSGEQSLLQLTLQRAHALVPRERIVVVSTGRHTPLARQQSQEVGGATVLHQPFNVGTGNGLLLPLAHVRTLDPDAQVLVLPSDHYVRRPVSFTAALGKLGRGAMDHRLTLLGVVPEGPESEYGWIVPGAPVTLRAPLIRQVDRFVEKPPPTIAAELMRQGALWNTFVLAGSIDAFWTLAEENLPAQARRFAELSAELTSQRGQRELAAIYDKLPPADFSAGVLQNARNLAVATAPACGWSDWGTPRRVFESLAGTAELEQLQRRLGRADAPVAAPAPSRVTAPTR